MLLERKDGARETLTDAEFAALVPSLNPTKHVGNPTRRVEMTDAEVTAAEARAVVEAAEQAKAAALASIYEPVEYPAASGTFYPVGVQDMAKYELAKQARGRGNLAKGIAIATDGSLLKLSTAADIDAFHTAMESAVTARIEAVHDAL